MKGLHLTADLGGCSVECAAMRDPVVLRRWCLAALRQVGLAAVGDVFEPLPPPGGVTGLVLLADAHLAVHTWPERAGVSLDVCVFHPGDEESARAHRLVDILQAAFGAQRATRQHLARELPE